MKSANRFFSALVSAAVMAAAVPTLAASGWVNVSSWAYNEVSNFTTEGLIPESFADITDYKADITRVQFAELVYSVLKKSGISDIEERLTEEYDKTFEDSDSKAALALCGMNIIYGVEDGGGEMRFYPDAALTRQDAAAIVFRAFNVATYARYYSRFSVDEYKDKFADSEDIADYALMPAYVLMINDIMLGDGENNFRPNDNLTIEQAVTLCYRFYRRLPAAADNADGFGVDAETETETEIQSYPNGLIETKLGDMLYIKNGSNTVAEFETDVYSRIRSAGDYICAENFNHRTEVYRVSDGGKVCEIPASMYSVDEEYIITRENRTGETAFGLYDFSGNETLPAEYSLAEIAYLRNNDFNPPELVKTESEGWIYYINLDDGNTLYRTDTNGENTQKISDKSLDDPNTIEAYYNGRLFYNSDGGLRCVEGNGENEQLLSSGEAHIEAYGIPQSSELFGDDEAYTGFYLEHSGSIAESDGGIYMSEYTDDYARLWQIKFSESGTAEKTLLAELALADNTDGAAYTVYPIYGGGITVMLDVYTEPENDDYANRPHNVYVLTDGGLTQIPGDWSGCEVSPLGGGVFGLTVYSYSKYIMEYSTDNTRISSDYYLMDINGENRRSAPTYEPSGDTSDSTEADSGEYTVIPDASDDKFKLAYNYSGDSSNLYVLADDGGVMVLEDAAEWNIRARFEDVLYYTLDNIEQTHEANEGSWNIYKCDLNTGESTIALENIYTFFMTVEDKGILYLDGSGNMRLFDFSDGSISEVYPSKGLNPYGKLYALSRGSDTRYTRSGNRRILKIDTDGNVCDTVKCSVGDWIYVKDGDTAASDTEPYRKRYY